MSRFAVIAAGCAGLLLTFYVFQGAVSFTPAVVPPFRNEVVHYTRQLAPQGWAFFTKNAQSKFVVPYGLQSAGMKSLAGPVGASWEYALGFDRSGRAQGSEVAMVLSGVGKNQWAQCSSIESCGVAARSSPVRTRNVRTGPTICGDVLLVAMQPVPWEWRDLRSRPTPAEAIQLQIRC